MEGRGLQASGALPLPAGPPEGGRTRGRLRRELTQEVVEAEVPQGLGHVADGEAEVPHGRRLPRRLPGARQLTLVFHAIQ